MLLALGSAVAAAAGPVSVPQVPDFGSGIDSLDRNRYSCRVADSATACRRRAESGDGIEQEPVIEIVLFYRQDRLVRSVFAFDEARLDPIVAALSARLGSPVRSREGLMAGMGGVFDNRHFVWQRDGRVWFVEQFFERIISSALWIMSDAEFAALQAERASARVGGAREL